MFGSANQWSLVVARHAAPANHLSYFHAIVMGLLQGVTELFPVSSLGHAVVLPALLGWNVDQQSRTFLPFLVVLHVATATALLVYFWRDWWSLIVCVLGRAARRLIALTGTLMGGYADDLFNIFYRMEPHAMVREGFAYGGQGRRDFQEQYGVLETIEKVEEADNACSRATKKTVRVLRKPGASPMLFGKFLMTTTAFLSLEDISDNLPRYDESVISVDMDDALQRAYEQLE